jgi:hypothetical protein
LKNNLDTARQHKDTKIFLMGQRCILIIFRNESFWNYRLDIEMLVVSLDRQQCQQKNHNMEQLEHLKDAITKSVSSIFTKQDLLNLIQIISDQENPSEGLPTMSRAHFSFLCDRVQRVLDKAADNNELVNYSSAEFEIGSDNRLELNNVDVNLETINDYVSDSLNSVFEIID